MAVSAQLQIANMIGSFSTWQCEDSLTSCVLQKPEALCSLRKPAGHSDGTLRYNAHNLHGAAMAQQHYRAFVAATGKRPFNVIRWAGAAAAAAAVVKRATTANHMQAG